MLPDIKPEIHVGNDPVAKRAVEEQMSPIVAAFGFIGEAIRLGAKLNPDDIIKIQSAQKEHDINGDKV